MSVMTLEEISESAFSLGVQLQAGVNIDDAFITLSKIQLKYEDFWLSAKASIQEGRKISVIMGDIWPKNLVGAIVAGEESGNLPDSLDRIVESIELQLKIKEEVGKLRYPFVIMGIGLIISLLLTFVLVPIIIKSTSKNSTVHQDVGFITNVGNFVQGNWIAILITITGIIIALWKWYQTEEAKEQIMTFALGIPIIREALKNLYFGLWAYYMAMMTEAGITTLDALVMTEIILPRDMRESLTVFHDEIASNKSMSAAANLKELDDTDQRKIWWPVYISSAFIVAEQTGDIAAALLRIAPSLVKTGFRNLGNTVKTLHTIALAMAAMLLGVPYIIMYSTIIQSITAAF